MHGRLETQLRAALAGASRIAVLGAGSELRGDDGAGPLLVQELRKRTSKRCSGTIQTFDGGTAPENLTGAIRDFCPSHLIIIDTSELGRLPGTVAVIPPESIRTTAFSTHILPLSILVNYLERSIACKVIVIGIQPKSLQLQAPLSPEVHSAITELVTFIERIAGEHLGCTSAGCSATRSRR
jgi:hydrogenase 3 maturation protease